MGLGILRLQHGLDYSHHVHDDENHVTEEFHRNPSFSHMSQGK